MLPKHLLTKTDGLISGEPRSGRRLTLLLGLVALLTVWAITLELASEKNPTTSSTNALSEDAMDHALQRVATMALGEKRGTIIIMDPQTGRVRAVVNPKLAFEENLPPGSTIKPFTTLAAYRLGLIDDDSRTACREEYVQDDFRTVCSHPRDLPPLSPTDAIAYSCNYFFGRLGERLAETAFVSTLGEFGFGKKTGINVDNESSGKLLRNGWHSQNAIGEGDNVLATPIQVASAYSALVNGGHLMTPRIASAAGFIPRRQADLMIDAHQRLMIIKGMRGAVRYGTAETAGLYKIPNYVIGKTGTATEPNGFRSQGWFIGFAASIDGNTSTESQTGSDRATLAVLVFLAKAHGSDAAEVARPIFEEFSRSPAAPIAAPAMATADPARNATSPDVVRIHVGDHEVAQTAGLEDYVSRVVATEGSTENELEALKALAIAVRTYAVKNMGRHQKDGYDFCSTTHCQRYETGPTSKLVSQAVDTTRGEVLQDSLGKVAEAYFSASCGGATANIGSLWGSSAPPHLRGVRDEACDTEAHHSWTDVISQAQLTRALQSDPRTNVGPFLANVKVIRRDQSDRAELIAVEGNRKAMIKGWEFKIIVGRALGWNLLKSSRFEIARAGSNFVFRGKGFGHGLGLCQEGAHVMASQGSNYRQILQKYFPTTHLDDNLRSSADLLWGTQKFDASPSATHAFAGTRGSRQTLSSENLRIDFPTTVERREVERLITFVQSNRRSLINRAASAGVHPRLPPLEIFINETTGNFVGRTGQPPWAAAATKNNRIELQPLPTLKARGILESTVKHELVHLVVDALSQGKAPRWLAEGLAVHFAGEGMLVSRYLPKQKMTVTELEQKLGASKSAEEMRTAYAAAWSEVKRLIRDEGESKVWRRVIQS